MSGKQYLPNTDADRRSMLANVGAAEIDDLFADIPSALRLNRALKLPAGLSEMEAASLLGQEAAKNITVDARPCFLGAGAYDHFVPSAVGALAGRSEFYTAYTQYQPEISQGGLQALWEYQSYICALTGMDVSNASLYDGATALAEAMHLACGQTNRSKVIVSGAVHPHYQRVLATYAHDLSIAIQTIDPADEASDLVEITGALQDDIAAVLLQTPNFYGSVEDLAGLAEKVHAAGALLILCANPMALALLKTPGEWGADIAVGEGQPLGLGLNFGGPYLGYMAVREKLMRRMPGRIVGQTTDLDGKRGYVLTLQAREQHIRREKAYSNICSNEGLCALTASIYLSMMGKEGLRQTAQLCYDKAHYLADILAALPNCKLVNQAPFFHEFVVELPVPANKANQALASAGFIGGFDLGRVEVKRNHQMLICVTEKRTRAEMDAFAAVLGGLK